MSATDFILGIENLALMGAVATGRLARPVRRPIRVRVCCRNLPAGKDSEQRTTVDDAPDLAAPEPAPVALDTAPVVRHWANGKFADTP